MTIASKEAMSARGIRCGDNVSGNETGCHDDVTRCSDNIPECSDDVVGCRDDVTAMDVLCCDADLILQVSF